MATPSPQIGLDESARKAIAEAMMVYLSNTYQLYTQTQIFHWNVEGPRFTQLHELFNTQYEQLSAALDEIAERIRALGVKVAPSLKALEAGSTLPQAGADLSEDEMISTLLEAHETMCRASRELIQLATEHGDDGNADFITARLEEHEKTAWMLRSHLA